MFVLIPCFVLGAGLLGCGGAKPTVDVPEAIDPEHEFRYAFSKRNWAKAWEFAEQVLTADPDNLDLIVKAGIVANEVGETERAADLLVRACDIENYQSEQRVRQAVVGQISVGRLHEALQWLETVLQEQPDQHGTRRWLFDLYSNIDRRQAAIPHGQALVRKRQFDAKLLVALGMTDPISPKTEAVNTMVERNPDDRRPLLRVAANAFREQRYRDSVKELRGILEKHTKFAPAHAMLAHALVRAGEADEAAEQIRVASDHGAEQQPSFWFASAELALKQDDHSAALNAYLRAAACDYNQVNAWQGIVDATDRIAMMQNSTGEDSTDQATKFPIDRAKQRLSGLQKIEKSVDLFDRTGRISRQLAITIARELKLLGRIWEAEAWASLALTLPPDENVPVEQVRQEIVGLLNNDLPFQTLEGFEEIQTLTKL